MRNNHMKSKKVKGGLRSFEQRNDLHRAAEMLEKLHEILHRDTCLTNDGAKGAAIKSFVVRHNKLLQ